MAHNASELLTVPNHEMINSAVTTIDTSIISADGLSVKSCDDHTPIIVFLGAEKTGKTSLIEYISRTNAYREYNDYGNTPQNIQEHSCASLNFLRCGGLHERLDDFKIYEVPDDSIKEQWYVQNNRESVDRSTYIQYSIDFNAAKRSLLYRLFNPEAPEYLFKFKNRKVIFCVVFDESKNQRYINHLETTNHRSLAMLEYIYYHILKFQAEHDGIESLPNMKIRLFWHQMDWHQIDADPEEQYSKQISEYIETHITALAKNKFLEDFPEIADSTDHAINLRKVHDHVMPSRPLMTSHQSNSSMFRGIQHLGDLVGSFFMDEQISQNISDMMDETRERSNLKNIILVDLKTRLPIIYCKQEQAEENFETVFKAYYNIADSIEQLVIHFCNTLYQANSEDRCDLMQNVSPDCFDNSECKFEFQKMTLQIQVVDNYLALVCAYSQNDHSYRSNPRILGSIEHNLLQLKESIRKEVFSARKL